MIELVPAEQYKLVFYCTMFVICLLTGIYYLDSNSCQKLLKQNSALLPFLLTVILIIYIGLRPIRGRFFGDMAMYHHVWRLVDESSLATNLFESNREWFFQFIMVSSKRIVPEPQFFFLLVDVIYFGCHFWACKKLLWENVWLAVLFTFFSFQFFTFGTNGLRNGMGCSLMLVSIAYFADRTKKGYIIGLLFIILALGCHRSVLIPTVAMLISTFFFKDIKYPISIWLFCILLSLFAGNYFQNLFIGIGLDQRMSTYSSVSERTMTKFSHIGFRWDFLLYSSMPIVLAWFARYRGIINKTFYFLANTYIIANSFWVLVCRVAYSNRFAYLSWFLYALVIAYGVVRVPIWEKQDKNAGWILLGHSAFTMIMFIIGEL